MKINVIHFGRSICFLGRKNKFVNLFCLKKTIHARITKDFPFLGVNDKKKICVRISFRQNRIIEAIIYLRALRLGKINEVEEY